MQKIFPYLKSAYFHANYDSFTYQIIIIIIRSTIKMSRVGRTRRTRVYDCNFDKGESYYRPVLDRLDGKVPTPRTDESDRDRIRSDVENRIKSALDDVQSSAVADDLFDSRGARVQRSRPLSSALDTEELSEDVSVMILVFHF